MALALVWFRDDLRLDDQPALQAALAQGYAPVPVHVSDDVGGGASEAWRARSLAALDAALRSRGSRMVFASGPSLDTLQRLAVEFGAEAVFWTRRYEPEIERRDEAIKRALRRSGLHAESHNGALLVEPWNVETKGGDPYKVFTAFWKTASAQIRLAPSWKAPSRLPGFPPSPSGGGPGHSPSPAGGGPGWGRFDALTRPWFAPPAERPHPSPPPAGEGARP
jgi:deoxyribodipyrimidine photo-lyase